MARQPHNLDDFVIPAGETESNWVDFKGTLSDVEVITIYAGGSVPATVEIDSGRKMSGPLYYKGTPVKIAAKAATNVPVPACNRMRLVAASKVTTEQVYQITVLLGV